MIIYPHSHQYKNLNAIFFKLSDDEVAPLKSESITFLEKIIHSKEQLQKELCYSSHLPKHVTHQYALNDTITEHVENLLSPVVSEYIKRYAPDTFLNQNNLTLLKNGGNSCWINFQQKHEFHPIHIHFGIFSFVIWINIPYTIKEKSDPHQLSEVAPEGDFHFILRGEDKIQTLGLNVDNKWENRGVLFLSTLAHLVYPFYTSDDYRITISGNFKVK